MQKPFVQGVEGLCAYVVGDGLKWLSHPLVELSDGLLHVGFLETAQSDPARDEAGELNTCPLSHQGGHMIAQYADHSWRCVALNHQRRQHHPPGIRLQSVSECGIGTH